MIKRILSIDGGGIKGVFPASYLATIEDSIGDNVANYFDLIVGTSTGGILALGLGLGFSAKEILELYDELGPLVFGGNRPLRFFRQLGISKYSQKPLEDVLTSKFGDKKLGHSTKRLVVPSFNLETGEVYIYKTAHHPRFERDYKCTAVEVALATAAAPTYFPTHKSAAGTPLIDGGMWANNPTGLAVVEGIAVLDWPRDSIKLLSLGCTTVPLSIGAGRNLPLGLGYWAPRIVDVLMAGQASAALGTANVLAGHDNVVRISPVVAKGRFGLDKIKEIESLRGLGDSEARKSLPVVRKVFFGDRAEEFIPFQTL